MKKLNQFEYAFIVMGLMMASNTVGGKPNEPEARNSDLSSPNASNTSYKLFGETFYFDPNQLVPVLENRRYTFPASNGQIHVVDVVTDEYGTSTKAYRIDIDNGYRHSEISPSVAPTIKPSPPMPSIDSRVDAAASKFMNHQYQVGSWLSHGFTSVLPAQTQFQHIFMPSSGPPTSIVVPFALVFNPYTSVSGSPSLIHNSEKPIDPELINSIFQVPPNEQQNSIFNNQYAGAGGISSSLQPPFQTSTPPPPLPTQAVSSTTKPPASSTPHYNYFGTSTVPPRPSYLPPLEGALVNNIDIRYFKSASTEASSKILNNRFLMSDDDTESVDSNLSVAKPTIELLPPFED